MSVQTIKITRVWQTELSMVTRDLGSVSGIAGDVREYETIPVISEWMELDEDATPGDLVAEFSGRGCYESWDKPNPATATTEGYVNHVLDVGHLSLFAHASVAYYIEGVSRSLTHELIRHRWMSFSQLSQRYVNVSDDLPYVVPPLFRGDQISEHMLAATAQFEQSQYAKLVSYWDQKREQEIEQFGHSMLTRKRIREAARSVLPNMTETKIGVTANLRAWRDMLRQRLPKTADAEIQELARLIYNDLCDYAPHSMQGIELLET